MQQETERSQASLGLRVLSILMLVLAVAAMCFCTLWFFFHMPHYREAFCNMGVKLPEGTIHLFEIPSFIFKVFPIAIGAVLALLEIVISRKMVTLWINLTVFLLSAAFWVYLELACSLPTLTLLRQLQGDSVN